jgi:cystathionine beta-lyase/cystathionine gamma-synthase
MTPNLGQTTPLVPPIYPSAVYCIPDLDAVDAIYNTEASGFIYARDGHPNATILAAELCAMHRANWGVVTASGMGALAAPMVALLAQGDNVLASNRLYGKTTRLLRQEFARFGIATTWIDTNDLDAVRAGLQQTHAKILLAETISNPLCRVADIPALAELCREFQSRLFIDNTFATPVLCKPLELGAHLVMESLTKMIGGHSDVTQGFVAGLETELDAPIRSAVSTWGCSANPFDCWLTSRGAGTLDLRMPASTANAQKLAHWLAAQPGVNRVVYPGRTDHPDFVLSQRLFPNGAGNMLCFELANRDAVNRWMRATPSVPFCPSLGHHLTTCSHPDTTSHRFESKEEKLAQRITPGLIRLSVGCEPLVDIQSAIYRGLTH